MNNKNGKLYCKNADSWCANGLNCDRINCMSNKKAPTGAGTPKLGTNQINQLQNSIDKRHCQGGLDGVIK